MASHTIFLVNGLYISSLPTSRNLGQAVIACSAAIAGTSSIVSFKLVNADPTLLGRASIDFQYFLWTFFQNDLKKVFIFAHKFLSSFSAILFID